MEAHSKILLISYEITNHRYENSIRYTALLLFDFVIFFPHFCSDKSVYVPCFQEFHFANVFKTLCFYGVPFTEHFDFHADCEQIATKKRRELYSETSLSFTN